MNIDSLKIISFLNLECLNSKSFKIKSIKPPNDLVDGCYTLLTRESEFDTLFDSNSTINVLAVIPSNLKVKAKNRPLTFLLSNDVRTDFVKGMHNIIEIPFTPKISNTCSINSKKEISKNILIGHNVVINGNVEIGDNCEIYDNVVISGEVKIGDNVRIQSGSVIGQKGFNYVFDDNKHPIEFIHLGSVEIGDNVDIGANVSIAQGTLGKTIISDNVKIDDQALIAHNVKIGKNSFILGGVVICGSTTIGENSWISPNCSIIGHIKIGKNVTVGIGSTVLKSAPDNSMLFGNPALIQKTNK